MYSYTGTEHIENVSTTTIDKICKTRQWKSWSLSLKKKANHNSILPHSFSPWKTASNDSMAVVLFFWKQYDPTEWRTKKPLLFCSFEVTALLIIYHQPERSWELVDENLNTEYWIWNFGYGTVERNRDQYITKNKWIIKLIKESKRRLKKDKLGAIASTPLVHSVLSSKLTYNFNQ